MLEFLDGSLSDLDEETRLQLANLLARRNEYMTHVGELNKRKITLLMNPSAEAERELAEFSSAVVSPLRHRLSEEMGALLQKAVDVEQIKSILPLIMVGVARSINFNLLFTVVGLDPDMVAEGVGLLKEYFSDLTD